MIQRAAKHLAPTQRHTPQRTRIRSLVARRRRTATSVKLDARIVLGKLRPAMGIRLMVGQRTLNPYVGVRILHPQPHGAFV